MRRVSLEPVRSGRHTCQVFTFTLPDRRALRLLEESDAEDLYALIERDRDHLARWLPWAGTQTLDGARSFLAQTRRQLADNDGFQAAVLDDERIVGALGYHRLDWPNRCTSVGYWLSEEAQGKGTMTLAVSALVDWAFRGWELNRVEIRAAVENRRSRAIPERLGFHQEATLRQVERVGERFLDSVVYSVLASEWGTTTALPSNRPARRSDSASSARSSG